jgi:hypothetical protein
MLIAMPRSGSKDALLARNSYLPGDRNWNPNRPCSSEVVDSSSEVSWLTRTIDAPGSATPDGSSAIPARAPVEAVWPRTRLVVKFAITKNPEKDKK